DYSDLLFKRDLSRKPVPLRNRMGTLPRIRRSRGAGASGFPYDPPGEVPGQGALCATAALDRWLALDTRPGIERGLINHRRERVQADTQQQHWTADPKEHKQALKGKGADELCSLLVPQTRGYVPLLGCREQRAVTPQQNHDNEQRDQERGVSGDGSPVALRLGLCIRKNVGIRFFGEGYEVLPSSAPRASTVLPAGVMKESDVVGEVFFAHGWAVIDSDHPCTRRDRRESVPQPGA